MYICTCVYMLTYICWYSCVQNIKYMYVTYIYLNLHRYVCTRRYVIISYHTYTHVDIHIHIYVHDHVRICVYMHEM